MPRAIIGLKARDRCDWLVYSKDLLVQLKPFDLTSQTKQRSISGVVVRIRGKWHADPLLHELRTTSSLSASATFPDTAGFGIHHDSSMNFQPLRSVRETVRRGFNLAEAMHASQPGSAAS